MKSALRLASSALVMTALMVQSGVAQNLTNISSDQQSIELGNLEGPEDANMPAAASQEMQANAGAPTEITISNTNANEQADNKITSGASTPEPVAATPMERYRDLKLQQAASSYASNPSTIRRYLKVDRSAFADSNGVQ